MRLSPVTSRPADHRRTELLVAATEHMSLTAYGRHDNLSRAIALFQQVQQLRFTGIGQQHLVVADRVDPEQGIGKA